MKEGVREFLLEEVILQVILYALLDQGHVQNGVDRGALARVLLQAHLHDVFEGPGVAFWEWRILVIAYLFPQLRQIATVPRCAQCEHFVEKSAQRPNVTLRIVGLLFEHLGRQIKGCANNRTCLVPSSAEHSGDSKVAKFTHTPSIQEHVSCCQVSMQNLSIVTVL